MSSWFTFGGVPLNGGGGDPTIGMVGSTFSHSENWGGNQPTSFAEISVQKPGDYFASDRLGNRTTNAQTIHAGAVSNLATLMSGDPSGGYSERIRRLMNGDYGPSDPSYAWRFNQGQQALERSQAARGLLGSGNAATELVQYGQGLASTEYGSEFTRALQAAGLSENAFQASYGRLAELAGMNTGLQSAGMSAGVGYANVAQRKREADIAQQNREDRDAGFQELLNTRLRPPAGPTGLTGAGSGSTSVDPMSGYYSYQDTAQPSYGSWESSSGASGTFGGEGY